MSNDDELSVGVVVPAPGTGGCEHGRPSWRVCPHCNGTNIVTTTASVDLQARIDHALELLVAFERQKYNRRRYAEIIHSIRTALTGEPK